MRRQTATSGINPAGSSRALRLDPLSLPLRFDAQDSRADGGVRQIELHRERVVLRRAIQGMRMAVNVRVSDFRGVALRGRTKIVVRGTISDYIPNPTFEVVARPGAHEEFYKRGNPEGKSMRELTGEPILS